MTRANDPGHWFEADPLWFKTAVFYEVLVRSFRDGNGDGTGDFVGLIEKPKPRPETVEAAFRAKHSNGSAASDSASVQPAE